MKSHLAVPLFLIACLPVAWAGGPVEVMIDNPTPHPWVEAPVVVKATGPLANLGTAVTVLLGPQILPVQVDDLDRDGKPDEIVFLAPVAAGTQVAYTLEQGVCDFTPPSRAHAGMYVKGFEGPGWESDRLAFRLYWDERNAMDIFCKRKPVLGLREYAKPDVNYHQDTPWGMDVLKVGQSVGAGGFGVYIGGAVHKVAKAERDFEVLADGPLRAIIDLKYNNWEVGERKFRLTARMSCIAGQPFCDVELRLTPLDDGPIPELVAGLVKHEGMELVKDPAAGILGRWGLQALGPGEVPKSANLGLGIVVDPALVAEMGEDANNSYIRLRGEEVAPAADKPAAKESVVRYRVTANWQHEPHAAQSAAEFEASLRQLAALKPVVTVKQD